MQDTQPTTENPNAFDAEQFRVEARLQLALDSIRCLYRFNSEETFACDNEAVWIIRMRPPACGHDEPRGNTLRFCDRHIGSFWGTLYQGGGWKCRHESHEEYVRESYRDRLISVERM